MKNNLTIAILQYDIVWENPEANFQKIEQIIEGVKADIFLLPEMFSTGFSMTPEKVAEQAYGPSFLFLQRLAIEKNAAFCASIPVKSGNKYYNRLYWVAPNEVFFTYDKKHLFSYAGEDKHYSPGTEKRTVPHDGWNFLPLVCYDLRFPYWSSNDGSIDIIFYVANWPEARIAHWDLLLPARALENQCYCFGINRTGKDDEGNVYPGHSIGYKYDGTPLENLSKNDEVLLYEVDKESLSGFRKKFPFLKDVDQEV
ncbi:MAG: nitrilase-related carbon-nitrogen hydrolase [Weeksellaceae bacterium]|nr:nitrilase-related carbon-nitrogen hydrolase [Weeksellaceae bacterium]